MVHNYKKEGLSDKSYKYTLGYVDFGADMTKVMRTVDGTIVLCCADGGVMLQTETVLRQALRERIKTNSVYK